ncbi:MAG: aldehyde dehydrogenase family protein [Phycisphaerales bacterium]
MTAAQHPSLLHAPSNLVGGRWLAGPGGGVGAPVVSRNPARPASIVHSCGAHPEHVDAAVAAAAGAFKAWSRWPMERRVAVLRRFQKLAGERAGPLAEVLCDEIGKVLWECKQEAALLGTKVEISLDEAPEGGRRRVTPFAFAMTPSRQARCLFRPHGVMAVLGPYNFPLHLPNGHIVPALLAGNTVVFKPSDKAPACGQALVELFDQALREEGAPADGAGVVNMVQGGGDVAAALVAHAGVDAIAFTGSWPVGRRILEANLDRPGRIAALEMGGNNAAVVMPDADLRQAAIEVTRCAFNTTGQRCTSTRRAIIHESVAGRLITAICKAATQLIIGDPRATHPVFCGPIINDASRHAVFEFQTRAAKAGAEVLVEATPMDVAGCEGGHFLTPGVVRMHPAASPLPLGGAGGGTHADTHDTEVFGPLLQVFVVKDLDEAILRVNATRYGLAASIFTKDAGDIERFLAECRAGCVNVNTGTAGASSKLPFGGLGLSGNHRPAGSFALDYCAYPVAAMVESGGAATVAEGMRFEDGWVA